MAKGMKISRANGQQVGQTISPIQFTYAASTTSSATVYRGGTGGYTSGTTSLVISTTYKTAAAVQKTDGQIVRQRGAYQFMCQSAADTDPTKPTLTTCVLVGGSSAPTLAASQMFIKAVSPTGVLFYATRITDRYVWNGTARYPYVLGTSAAVTYNDTTSTTGVVLTNSVGGSADDVYAMVLGA
jgi:hypothetical protein